MTPIVEDVARQFVTMARQEDWTRRLRALARQVESDDAVLPAIAALDRLERSEVTVAFIGTPNSGRSTLLNALLGRNILPVSALTSGLEIEIVAAMDGAAESFAGEEAAAPLAGHAQWWREEIKGRARITLDSSWLRAGDLRLVERRGFDAVGDAEAARLEEQLAGVDFVIAVIDASMPLKRSDVKVIGECGNRKLPVVIVLTKLDAIVPAERDHVREYVARYAETAHPVALVESSAGKDNQADLEELRRVIDAGVEAAAVAQVRIEQARGALAGALLKVSAAAESALLVETKNAAEQRAAHERRRVQLESEDLLWAEIGQQLDERRQQIEREIRTGLESRRQDILEVLVHSVETAADVKAWWERDLRFHLQHELRGVAERISAELSRRMSADLKWLQDEIHRRFRCDLAVSIAEPEAIVLDGRIDQKSLPLRDARKLRIVARVGTAATVFGAGVLFSMTTIAGSILAVGMLAGLAAEEIGRRLTGKDREKVRDELDRIVGRAFLDFATDASRRLKASYDEILRAVKRYHERWEADQLQTLGAPPPAPARVGILREVVHDAGGLRLAIDAVIAASPTRRAL